ncbi:putative quinol monooxygenase [Arthrobacter sp. NPDC093125]|uniref:putative quinol monooxygenase n=1 Tax=Arthrobacter sp. NPDC093125 TaxID=3363944 RepID=UPI003804ABE8
MFSLWVTLEVKPEGREEFLEAIAENAQRSVQDEPGCYRFDVVESGARSNRFAFYEVYRDRAAFEEEHLSAPHFLAYREVSARLVVPGSQAEVGGHLLASFDEMPGKGRHPQT